VYDIWPVDIQKIPALKLNAILKLKPPGQGPSPAIVPKSLKTRSPLPAGEPYLKEKVGYKAERSDVQRWILVFLRVRVRESDEGRWLFVT